jgi:two-component system response regulator YesN
MQLSSQTLFRSLPASSPSPKGRVLVVDDEENVAILLQHILARLGPDLEVWAANSGAQALDLLNDERLDLLITDYQMSYMTGLELTQTVRQRYPEVKIILMTAYSSPQIIDLADRLAIDGYLIKPFSGHALREIVCKLLTPSASLSLPSGGNDHDDSENRDPCR